MKDEYVVTWEMDIQAESTEDAAREALMIMSDPASTATVFTVTKRNGESETIDLLELDEGQQK